jgi:hypothetical protein
MTGLRSCWIIIEHDEHKVGLTLEMVMDSSQQVIGAVREFWQGC